MNLKDEILAGESATLEFKRCPNENAERWLKTVVAFANGKGGRILFGVDNDRTVVGLDGNLFAIRDSISDAVADACSPLISILLGMVTVDGKAILVLDVPQGRQCPYFIKSMGETEGVFVRHDATTRKADEVTLQELRLAGAGRSYDQLECRGLTADENAISSLCDSLHEYALKNARTDAQRADVKPLTRVQLRKWGVLLARGESDVASNAFALLVGCEPLETTTKCAVFKGNTRTVFLDRRVFDGPVQSQAESAYRYILEKINVGARFDGLGRVETYEIPPDAIREIVINAYVHRSYVNGSGTSVSVAIYDDRIEITSPGGLPRDVSVKKVLAGYSECRNEALVHAFAYMGLMEDWGTGLPRASEELKAAGLPNLEMTDWGNAVRVTIYRQSPPTDVGKDGGDGEIKSCDGEINSADGALNGANGAINSGIGKINGEINDGDGEIKPLSKTERELSQAQRIIAIVRKNPGIKRCQLVVKSGMPFRSLDRLLHSMTVDSRASAIEYRGSKKTGGWFIKA